MGKIKDMTEGLRMLKDLKKGLGDIDMNDPQKMLDSMGLNMDELNKSFIEASSPKTKLRY